MPRTSVTLARFAIALLFGTLAISSCRHENVAGVDLEMGDNALRQSIDDADDKAPLASPAYALTESNMLFQFDLAEPKRVRGEKKIKGLDKSVDLLAIDFRSATGALYALGDDSRIYTINVNTLVATPIGAAPFSPALNGSAFGFDFNPTVDRIRVVSNTGQNLRLHPDTGALAAMDSMIAYNATDVNAGRTPRVTAVAYTNPDNNPATGTTLYDIDAMLDVLTTQAPPNNGRLNTIGSLGVNATDFAALDITLVGATNMAYLATGSGRKGENHNHLVQVDLTTGATTDLGRIGHGRKVVGIAIPTQP